MMMSVSMGVFRKALSLARALLWGRDVSPERLEARLSICRECAYSETRGEIMRCRVCGCRLREDGALINLARYEEVDGVYGCKHPEGSRWIAAGV